MNKRNAIFNLGNCQVHESVGLENIKRAMVADRSLGTVGGFLVVVNDDGLVIGTITDSDLRKYFLHTSGGNVESISNRIQARDVMNPNFVKVKFTLTLTEMGLEVLTQLSKRNIRNEFPINYIPVLDEGGRLHSLVHMSSLLPAIDEETRQIFVVGQGFVGLTMAMAMVGAGLKVHGIERKISTFEKIRSLSPEVHEPQLNTILSQNIDKNYLVSMDSIINFDRPNFMGRRTYIIAVGTPMQSRVVDLSQVYETINEICDNLNFGDLIILRSTVPVGTTRKIMEFIKDKTKLIAGVHYNLAYAPERTVEGNAIAEVVRIPQLIAGFSEECTNVTMKFFASWVTTVIPMENLEACEFAKLISNAFRDVSFGFANEISILANDLNLDVNRLIFNANFGYSRNSIPQPSPGVGGPCLTKDSYMIDFNRQSTVIGAARAVNEKMIDFCVGKILDLVNSFGREVIVIGAAFKGYPETNDLRNSTSIEISKQLNQHGVKTFFVDHVISTQKLKEFGLAEYAGQESPRIFAILNNHIENKRIFRTILNQIKNDESAKFALFDPWSLVDKNEFGSEILMSVTLSKKEVRSKS